MAIEIKGGFDADRFCVQARMRKTQKPGARFTCTFCGEGGHSSFLSCISLTIF